ncbi:MAG: hypothetical protein GOV01_02405 [Candidatus Altiarchaeota archaeon]|nr:hypothetical protein [Candidatus Altiarchaeota archaeon]
MNETLTDDFMSEQLTSVYAFAENNTKENLSLSPTDSFELNKIDIYTDKPNREGVENEFSIYKLPINGTDSLAYEFLDYSGVTIDEIKDGTIPTETLGKGEMKNHIGNFINKYQHTEPAEIEMRTQYTLNGIENTSYTQF